MISSEEIRLAKTCDAVTIAKFSRDLIEPGLGWSWTQSRVFREIRSRHSNVVVSVEGNQIIGFAIMRYMEKEARLDLLGVHQNYRRKGIGKRLVRWLEETALVNGNGIVYLETRLKSHEARKFYQSLGYKAVERIPGYYKGRETAIRMAHDLWSDLSRK